MAADRFVYFDARVPTHDEVQLILTNYLGGCGRVEKPLSNRWSIQLPGVNTSPFAGIEGERPLHVEGERWIEVILERGKSSSLDFLTRAQDEFTNGIAHQLACAFARFYNGKYKD